MIHYLLACFLLLFPAWVVAMDTALRATSSITLPDLIKSPEAALNQISLAEQSCKETFKELIKQQPSLTTARILEMPKVCQKSRQDIIRKARKELDGTTWEEPVFNAGKWVRKLFIEVIEEGQNPDGITVDGKTMLHRCVELDACLMAEELVRRGARGYTEIAELSKKKSKKMQIIMQNRDKIRISWVIKGEFDLCAIS